MGCIFAFFSNKKEKRQTSAFRIGLAVLNELATTSVLTVPQNS